MMKILSMLTVISAILAVNTLLAQEPRDVPKKVRELKKTKLIEELQLNDKQKEPFTKLYDEFLTERRELNQAKKKTFKRLMLMSELGSDVADDKILSAIHELESTEKKLSVQQEKMIRDLKSFLTAPQLARYIVFEEHFDHRMRELMFKFRGRDHKKGPVDFQGFPFIDERE